MELNVNMDLNSGWIRGSEDCKQGDWYPNWSLKEMIDVEERTVPQEQKKCIKHYDPDTLEVTHCLTLIEAKRLLKLNQL